MRYGFILDQRKCIGCHACTVACKAENDVALGNFRTWVKYTEKGAFPNVTRNFLVERCNHCDDAPCVNICPVTALWRRDDGIIDFSTDRCIGCKSCMAACPYDAIYIDPASHTIGKCNYCAHRVDVGLQPACVNVCPVEAIITGDLDNPASRISQMLGREPAAVRRPEKGTRPKVFYLGAEEAALTPEATSERHAYMMAESDPSKPIRTTMGATTEELEGTGFASSGLVQRDYSVAHTRPWGWEVSAYMWTKSLAAGTFMVAAGVEIGGATSSTVVLTILAPIIALIFLGLTGLLLVIDLERPERFLRVLTRPHWRSWLVIGAYIVTAYGAVLTVTLATAVLGLTSIHAELLWLGMVVAVPTAVYTAFLLAQATGRDLWQSPLLAPHMLVQAVIAGASSLAVLVAALDPGIVTLVAIILAIALATGLVLILSEINMPHVTVHTRVAINNMTQGKAEAPFWLGIILGGTIVPLALAGWVAGGGPPAIIIVAAIMALAGLAAYEHAYIRAGQSVPLS